MTDEAKGNCYQEAADMVVDLVMFGQVDPNSIKLVHGIPTLTRPPYIRFGHAWVEVNETFVMDAASGAGFPRDEYYRAGNIDPDECFYYDYSAVKKYLLEYGHYGPWEGPEAEAPIV